MTPCRLGVNVDHVATLRQQRREALPDPIYAALVAQAHGADSIVAHLREDRRHIQDRDIRLLKQTLAIPLAMEMAATEAMERMALEVLPARVCLVPEKRQELTTEGGLDVIGHRTALKKPSAGYRPRRLKSVFSLIRMRIRSVAPSHWEPIRWNCTRASMPRRPKARLEIGNWTGSGVLQSLP